LITSADNNKLKTIRKLHRKSWRAKLGLFCAEGEDLVDAAAAAGWEPQFVLRAGEDVEPDLLAEVSTLGSGTRVVGVYEQRWADADGPVLVYLHRVEDPGNVGTVIRSAHALCDATVVLGPGCADPFSPKAVRASMGALFARPPAHAALEDLGGRVVALDTAGARTLAEADLSPPLVLCLGAEREGLPPDLLGQADDRVRIALREGGPESLNVAMAATVALHEVATRMAGHA
jgi:RNA methyltransferase, TrmH family